MSDPIDSHVHLYPATLNRDPVAWAAGRGEAHWALLCTRRRRDGRFVQGFAAPADLIRAMDEAGIARAILLGWYWEQPETCALQNDFYGECIASWPDRLSACATLHPRAGREAVLDSIRRARDKGFVGLGELSPHAQGYAWDDATFGAALQLAGELGLPVNLHVTDPSTTPYPGRVLTPHEDFRRLAERFPATTFVLAHWGGGSAIGAGCPNVFYDTAASPLLYGPEIWKRFVAEAGADRVLFGSDFPLNLYPKVSQEAELARLVDEANTSGLKEKELRLVLMENARKVFRL